MKFRNKVSQTFGRLTDFKENFMRRYRNFQRIVMSLAMTTCFVAAGCKSGKNIFQSRRYTQNRLSLEIVLQEGDRDEVPESAVLLRRKWRSKGRWSPDSSYRSIELAFAEENSEDTIRTANIHLDDTAPDALWPQSTQPSEPVNLSFTSEMGKLTFEGEPGSDAGHQDATAFGAVRIEINRPRMKIVKEAFGQGPSLETLITLIVRDVTAEQLIEFADCGVKLEIGQAGELAAYDYTAATVRTLIENGYEFEAEDFIHLARYHISADYTIGWKQANYDLSAKQLTYARQRNLDSDTAIEWQEAGRKLSLENLYWLKQRNIRAREAIVWKNAGYDLSLEQLYWVKQRNISPGEFSAWKDTGYELSLDRLYWVKQRNVSPQEAAGWIEKARKLSTDELYWARQRNLRPQQAQDWKKAGYDLSLEQLYWVKQRNLSPREARQWNDLGYDLSIEDLYRLGQHNIQSSYAEAFADPDYEPLSVEQLIEFRQSNISAETIKTLRKKKEQ